MKPRTQLPLAILIGVVVRFPFWVEALRTPLDGDTSIIGLMARHPGVGTTMWGQPYGSLLDSWLAAPLVAAMGCRPEPLRLLYFLLGLALIPLAHALAGRLDPRAAFPAAVLMACPPPYFLLLSSLPPPFYPTTLLLCAVLLVLVLRLGERLGRGEAPRLEMAAAGALAGLALWTHLMSASVVAPSAAYLLLRARGRRLALIFALVPLLASSAPWWTRALLDGQATRIVRVSDREETMAEHLLSVVPHMLRPVGGLLGTHVPLLADDPDYVLLAPRAVAAALVVVYGLMLILAACASRGRGAAGLLLAVVVLTLVAFPFPVRSAPQNIRFLTPLYLPLLALVAWAPVAWGRPRRAFLVVLLLAALHLAGGARLLAAWRAQDRAAAPFLLPDLAPVRRALEARGIRRAYASYGPAYRLTFESGERLVVSQPWNERFRHYPLPYLGEVRFAKNVAWVLTPAIPTDLPAPLAFESALGAMGGRWQRTEAGPAVLYHAFVPPFAPTVEPMPGAGPAGALDLGTALRPDVVAPTTFTLPAPRALDAVTFVAGPWGPTLLRSMDIDVSADGRSFETVARRRRRQEREDLRWVNGQPQYVIDDDLIAVPLGGRVVAAVRVTPYASTEEWAVAEVLLHPAQDSGRRAPWDEWLDPNLDWAGRRRALAADPRRDREDWFYRSLLAERH